jgi:hypothetical protein
MAGEEGSKDRSVRKESIAKMDEKKCPYFVCKIDRDDGVGICCNGRNERYESESDRDAWLAMRCKSESYVECDGYMASNFES